MKKRLILWSIVVCISVLVVGIWVGLSVTKKYKVDVISSGTEDAILSGSGYYRIGDEVELVAGEVEGYKFCYWIFNDTAVSDANPYKFKLNYETKGIYIAVYQGEYSITIGECKNGRISVSDSTANENDEVIVNVEPAQFYELSSLYYTYDGTNTRINKIDGVYKFFMPGYNIVINAVFVKKQKLEFFDQNMLYYFLKKLLFLPSHCHIHT